MSQIEYTNQIRNILNHNSRRVLMCEIAIGAVALLTLIGIYASF